MKATFLEKENRKCKTCFWEVYCQVRPLYCDGIHTNAPDGLFERIEKEAEDTCLYKRLFLDYTYGIGKIYTAEEIEKAKQSSSFEREYNLRYLGKIGKVFHTKDIEAAIEKGSLFELL